MGSIILLVAVFALMYFFMIRPQRKRAAERAAMLRAADIGDEVATVGGVIGKIVAVEEQNDVLCLEVDTDVELRVQRRAVGEILNSAAADSDSAGDSAVTDGVNESE
ncbi:preprotein translocase subunit YajC [Candidatus Poriferisodalis sp.]|uniref:preprotein translocase subunit YajC n=1 Tax=Candidatus Poriferisodalis sp. TaxID=3101277 RepID=UPI003B01CCDE